MKTIINGRQKDDNHEIYSKYQKSLISIIASQSLLRAVEIAKSALNEQKVVYDDELSVGEYWVGKLREEEDKNEMYKKEIAELESDLADVKAKRDTLMGCFFEFETVAPNGDLMASVLDMNKRILELEAENKALKDKTRWIPVSEKLPENDDYVLFWEDDDDIFLGNYDVNNQEWESVEGYFWSGNQFKHITHWMYVPELPES